MENTSENGQSRGKLRLEKTDEVSNMILEHAEGDNSAIPMYTVENSELDSILGDATQTKAEQAQTEKTEQAQEKQQKGQMLSAEKAAEIALGGLQEFCDAMSSHTGKPLGFGKNFVKVFTAATTPVIQKYSRHVDLDPKNIDLDSWVPELLALGSVSAVGCSTFLQMRKPPPVVDQEDSKGGVSGDKSEPSA